MFPGTRAVCLAPHCLLPWLGGLFPPPSGSEKNPQICLQFTSTSTQGVPAGHRQKPRTASTTRWQMAAQMIAECSENKSGDKTPLFPLLLSVFCLLKMASSPASKSKEKSIQ